VVPVLGSLVLGAAFALLLDRKFFGQGIVRTLLITPFLLMPVVVGLIWKNQMFHGSRRDQLADREARRHTGEFVSRYPTGQIAVTLIWQWDTVMMLIMLAGLQSQPSDVIEAAKVDGATPFGIFRQLTLGTCAPTWSSASCSGTITDPGLRPGAVMTGGGPGSTNVPYFCSSARSARGWEFGLASSYSIVVVIARSSSHLRAARALGALEGETSHEGQTRRPVGERRSVNRAFRVLAWGSARVLLPVF